MFGSPKLIIVRNHPALVDETLGQKFFQILVASNWSHQIIFALEAAKLNHRNNLVNFLLQRARVVAVPKLTDRNVVRTINQIVSERGAKISPSATHELTLRLPLDLWTIVSEIDKLLLTSTQISREMVVEQIARQNQGGLFDFSRAILEQDNEQIITAYRNRQKLGDDPAFMLHQINQLLSLALEISYHKNLGQSDYEISESTQIPLWKVKQGQQLLTEVGPSKIKELILELAAVDLAIKQGQVDKHLALEKFVLKLLK